MQIIFCITTSGIFVDVDIVARRTHNCHTSVIHSNLSLDTYLIYVFTYLGKLTMANVDAEYNKTLSIYLTSKSQNINIDSMT